MLGKNILVKGQSLVEIVAFIAVVSLAILAMQVYIQRGIQGKTKDLTDGIIGSQQRAYTAEEATSSSSTRFSGTTKVSTSTGGSRTKNINEATQETSESWSKGKP